MNREEHARAAVDLVGSAIEALAAARREQPRTCCLDHHQRIADLYLRAAEIHYNLAHLAPEPRIEFHPKPGPPPGARS